MTSTAKRDAKIVALAVERAASKSQTRRNQLTRQIERLATRNVVVAPAKPVAPAPTPKPVVSKKDAWKNAPASATQIGRIRSKEARLGLDLTPLNGAGMTGMEARTWNAALNAKLGWTK